MSSPTCSPGPPNLQMPNSGCAPEDRALPGPEPGVAERSEPSGARARVCRSRVPTAQNTAPACMSFHRNGEMQRKHLRPAFPRCAGPGLLRTVPGSVSPPARLAPVQHKQQVQDRVGGGHPFLLPRGSCSVARQVGREPSAEDPVFIFKLHVLCIMNCLHTRWC